MDRASAEEWLDRYRRAWEEQDPDAVVELFSEDATYRETPFDEPMRGRDAIHEYWSQVPRLQRDIAFSSRLLHAEDDLAIALWQASYVRVATAEPVRLDGIFVLWFAPGGRCRELREWWHASGEPAF